MFSFAGRELQMTLGAKNNTRPILIVFAFFSFLFSIFSSFSAATPLPPRAQIAAAPKVQVAPTRAAKEPPRGSRAAA